MSDNKTVSCNLCGKEVIKVEVGKGKFIHLDPKIRVYEIDNPGKAIQAPDGVFYISHTSVCKYSSVRLK